MVGKAGCWDRFELVLLYPVIKKTETLGRKYFFQFFFYDWIQQDKLKTIPIADFPYHFKVYKTKNSHLKVPIQ